MKNIYIFVIVVLLVPRIGFAQTRYSPFEGSFMFGSGICTIIDFNSNSQGFKTPIQFGLQTEKFINSNSFINIGLYYSSKGLRKVRTFEITHGTGTLYIRDAYEISIHCVEFSAMYYRLISRVEKSIILHFMGMSAAYLPVDPVVFPGFTVDLNSEVFRKFYPIVKSGFGIELGESMRLDIGYQLFVLPLIKRNYHSVFIEKTDYFGPYFFPIGIDLTLNYMFNTKY